MFKSVKHKTNPIVKDWYNFRQQIELSASPLADVHAYFDRLPKVKIYTDPYDQSRWPTPWELIDENEYCPFNIILGMCYTLQLTNRFSESNTIITISIDDINKTVYYLLFVDDKVYGYIEEEWASVEELPKTLKIQKIYAMKPLH